MELSDSLMGSRIWVNEHVVDEHVRLAPQYKRLTPSFPLSLNLTNAREIMQANIEVFGTLHLEYYVLLSATDIWDRTRCSVRRSV